MDYAHANANMFSAVWCAKYRMRERSEHPRINFQLASCIQHRKEILSSPTSAAYPFSRWLFERKVPIVNRSYTPAKCRHLWNCFHSSKRTCFSLSFSLSLSLSLCCARLTDDPVITADLPLFPSSPRNRELYNHNVSFSHTHTLRLWLMMFRNLPTTALTCIKRDTPYPTSNPQNMHTECGYPAMQYSDKCVHFAFSLSLCVNYRLTLVLYSFCCLSLYSSWAFGNTALKV